MSETKNLEDLIADGAKRATAVMHTSMPARVVSFDLATQTISAQPIIQGARDKPDGTRVQEDFPIINNIPVAFPSAAGFSLVFPLSKDDEVTLLFAERSLAEWKATGEAIATPQSLRRFDLSDAIAIPGGVAPVDPVPSAGVDAGAMVVRGTLIKLGSSTATDFVALASLVSTQLNAIRTTFNLHVHATAAPGPPAPPLPLLPAIGSVAATKVQAE